MKLGKTIAAALILTAAPLAAGVESTDAAKVAAGTYAIDASHSQVSGRVSHMGFSLTTVSFNKVSGSLSFDPAKLEAASLDVTLDATALISGFAARDEHLKGTQFFNVAAHPTIRYVAASLTPRDASHATVNGQLTLLGVTKPVAMEVTLLGTGTGMMKDTRIGFVGTAKLKRSDFGMTTFLPAVGDDVEIVIDAEFSRK